MGAAGCCGSPGRSDLAAAVAAAAAAAGGPAGDRHSAGHAGAAPAAVWRRVGASAGAPCPCRRRCCRTYSPPHPLPPPSSHPPPPPPVPLPTFLMLCPADTQTATMFYPATEELEEGANLGELIADGQIAFSESSAWRAGGRAGWRA